MTEWDVEQAYVLVGSFDLMLLLLLLRFLLFALNGQAACQRLADKWATSC